MLDFITQASQQLGTGEDTTRSATSALLGAIRKNTDGKDFNGALGSIPGVMDLRSGTPEEEAKPAGGGLLGGFGGGKGAGLMASMAGGGGSDSIVATLMESGLDLEQITPFLTMFLEHMQSKDGDGAIGALLSKVPGLGA